MAAPTNAFGGPRTDDCHAVSTWLHESVEFTSQASRVNGSCRMATFSMIWIVVKASPVTAASSERAHSPASVSSRARVGPGARSIPRQLESCGVMVIDLPMGRRTPTVGRSQRDSAGSFGPFADRVSASELSHTACGPDRLDDSQWDFGAPWRDVRLCSEGPPGVILKG